jgi:hypothetical protein
MMCCVWTDTPEVLSAVSNVRSSGADTSAEALGVVWELLTATLGVTLDEDVDACPEDVLGDAMDKEATGEVKVDRVHWYDARSRTAIRIVAHWLRVPWRRVSNLEVPPSLLPLCHGYHYSYRTTSRCLAACSALRSVRDTILMIHFVTSLESHVLFFRSFICTFFF